MLERHEIAVLGPAGVGKTQLVNLLRGQPFNAKYQSTIGIDVLKQKISDTRTILYRDIGSDSGASVIKKYLRTAHQIYIVFNVHDEKGLDNLKQYIEDFVFEEEAKVTLIGTHADEGISNNVENAAKVYAQELGVGVAEYYSISLKDANHPTLQILLSKSKRLPTAVIQPQPTKRQSLGNSSYNEDGKVITALSSYALQQHEQLLAGVHRRNDANDSKFIRAVDNIVMNDAMTPEIQRQISVYSSEQKVPRSRVSVQSMTPERRVSRFPNSEVRRPRAIETSPLPQPQSSVLHTSTPPPPRSRYSFALRMAGMAMMLAAVIGLIYIALAVVNIVSAAFLINLMNQIAIGVGSLLGASSSTSLLMISQASASLHLSTTAFAGMCMAVPNVALLGVGFGVFRASKRPEANAQGLDMTPSRQYR